MALIEIPVPHLRGGVSQQPPANRVPGQVSEAENCLLHVVNGLTRRHPVLHRARLFSGKESVVGLHTINRDPTERYKLLLGVDRIRAFDAVTGREYQVRDTNGALANGLSTVMGEYLNLRNTATDLLSYPSETEDFTGWVALNANLFGTDITTVEGPFYFGFDDGATSVDLIHLAGNGAAATVSGMSLAKGNFAATQVFSLFVRNAPAPDVTMSELELAFQDTSNAVDHTATFTQSGGVWAAGATSSGVTATATAVGTDGWYRLEIRVDVALVPVTMAGAARSLRVRFHHVSATPENKRALVFGARLDEYVDAAREYTLSAPDALKAVTLADYTFLLNTRVTVAPDLTPIPDVANQGRAFVFVKQGGFGDHHFEVTVESDTPGAVTAEDVTNADQTASPDSQTDDDIAENLRALINADAEFAATRVGSVIEITTVPAGDTITRLECTDSRGDQSMVAINGQVRKFEDLPLTCRHGYVVKVTGDPERDVDDYYVEFVAEDPSGAPFGPGVWEETVAVGAPAGLDASTMPLQLTRRQDDTAGTITGVPNDVYFELALADWFGRVVGDADSNEDPAFVGRRISDLFFHRGRLGFTAEDSVILSEAGDVFNFFRTTVLELVDTDPIDVDAGSRNVVVLSNAATTSEAAMLFSDREQFLLQGSPALTPATAQVVPVRAFDSIVQAHPVDSGRGVMFCDARGPFSGLYEALLLGDAQSFQFADLAAQAPRYLTGRAVRLAHSNLTGLTVAQTDTSDSVLYVHQTFWDDGENRLQSSWHRWTVGDDAAIREFAFLDSDLVLVVERDDGWYLEALDTTSELTEADGAPLVYLDRRVSESDLGLAYDGGSGMTTVTFPYPLDPAADPAVVDAASGLLIPVVDQPSASTVRLLGDFTTSALYAGQQFTTSVSLSEPVIHESGARGISTRMGRPLELRYLHLYVAGTAFVRSLVTADLRPADREDFTAEGLGTGFLGGGTLDLHTGDVTFAILGRSTETAVVLESGGPYPMSVQAARWAARFEPKGASIG